MTKLEIDGFYPSEEGSWTSAETHRRFYPTKDPGWCWAETREGKQCCARKGGIRRVGCLTCGTHEKQETAAQTLKAKLGKGLATRVSTGRAAGMTRQPPLREATRGTRA